MAEVGCLKDGNFHNLQVGETTILDTSTIRDDVIDGH